MIARRAVVSPGFSMTAVRSLMEARSSASQEGEDQTYGICVVIQNHRASTREERNQAKVELPSRLPSSKHRRPTLRRRWAPTPEPLPSLRIQLPRHLQHPLALCLNEQMYAMKPLRNLLISMIGWELSRRNPPLWVQMQRYWPHTDDSGGPLTCQGLRRKS